MRASTTGTTAGQMARRVGAVSGYQASYASCLGSSSIDRIVGECWKKLIVKLIPEEIRMQTCSISYLVARELKEIYIKQIFVIYCMWILRAFGQAT